MILTGDLFGICARVAEIDPLYFIKHNPKTGRFELHRDRSSLQNTLQLVLPFATLDARTVTYVRETRTERRKAMIAAIDAHNQKLEKENLYQSKKMFCDRLDNQLSKVKLK